MSRPALSATRGLEVIDLLASYPGRSFTLSEIARATKINTASCHAVLIALCARGYLTRSAKRRTYTFGPALVAIGQSALVSQPLVERAKLAAEELAADPGVPVLLTAVIGEDMLAIFSMSDPSGREPGLRVGERLPLIAPLGAPFLAWSPEDAIARWISRNSTHVDANLVAKWRRTLSLTRERGFHVTLRPPESPAAAALMAEMASPRSVMGAEAHVARLIDAIDYGALQPETLEPEALYDIVLIASPLFDEKGEAAFSVCLGPFPTKLSGATITAYADQLMRTCLQVMREARGAI
jgi:DNA-binding IclR family transcriptional regulator